MREPTDILRSRIRGRSVRFRLLAIALLPGLVILPLLLGVTFVRWNARFDAVLISKINGDLTIAHQYLSRILEKTGAQIRALGSSADFRDVVNAGGDSNLDGLLHQSRLDLALDFLYLTDNDGSILAAAPQFVSSSLRNDWPVIASALQRIPRTEIDIFTNEELKAIGPALAGRARLELVPTPNAVRSGFGETGATTSRAARSTRAISSRKRFRMRPRRRWASLLTDRSGGPTSD